MSYFKKIQSLDDLKEQFKKLAREHHPDAGGDAEIMKQINQEYDNLFPIWKHRHNISSEQPTEETSYSTRSQFYTENGWEGDKHDWNRDIKDVAALIRNYVKEVYPTYKFSVRIDRYSMGQTLYTELKEAPQDIYKTRDELTNEDLNVIYRKLKANSYYNGNELGGEEFEKALQKAWSESNFYKVYNEVTQTMIEDVEREVKSYNYQDIDSMIDYFHVDFHYFGVKVSSDLKIVEKQARVKAKEKSMKETRTDTKNQESTENNEYKRYKIEKSQHTKTGEDIWLVRINDKLERDEFLQEKQKMKELGGYYSKYTHSFVFKEEPSDKIDETLNTPKNSKGNRLVEEKIVLPETFEDWKKLGFDQPRLIYEYEAVLPIPDVEKITSYWGDMGEYEFKGNVSEQEAFKRYSKLRKLDYLSQKIQGVELGNFEWDEDNYLHFTAQVDGYELEGLFRTSDPQNGEDMNLVSIDYGYNHPQIKEQWNNIEEFLKEYSIEKYNEISHGKTTIVEENYKELMKLAPEIINGKRDQMDFTAGENFYSLSIENIGQDRISIMHWYVVNGDVVRDPDIEFVLDKENQTLTPMTYQQWDNYQSVENQDGTLDKVLQDDLNSFTKQWFTNLSAQGYISVEKVIENIRTYENSIGMPENKRITELDEDNHIHLKEGDEHVKDYVKYSHKCEEYLRFGYEVDEATSGVLSNIQRIKICDTPEILVKAGLEQKPMLYTQGHLAEALSPKERRNPHKHGLTIEQVKSLPEQFEEPAIIANNPSREDALLMVLCATDNDKLPLIVSVKPDGKGFYELEEVETNMVLTVFGKNNFQHYFESALLPDNIVYISKEKSQMLERLCERQLFACYSSIDFDIIIQKPECVVNMENQKYVRIIQVPEISFDKWLETSGYDKQKFPSEAERVEALMGRFEPHTQHSYGVLKGKQDKVEYYHKAFEAYQTEVKERKIPLTEKRLPLDLSKEQDQAFCRMEIKRLEKQGKHKEADNWRSYYKKNSVTVLSDKKIKENTYNSNLCSDVSPKLDAIKDTLKQENLGLEEGMDLEMEIG